MPKRSGTRAKTPKSRRATKPKADPNRAAFAVLEHIIQETEGTGKNPLAVALGRLGGLKGGKARAASMTDAERRASASNAAQARWHGTKDKGPNV